MEPPQKPLSKSLSQIIIGRWIRRGKRGEIIEFFPLNKSGIGIISTIDKDLDITVYGKYKFVNEDTISVLWDNFNTPEKHHLKLNGDVLIIAAGNIPWEYTRVK